MFVCCCLFCFVFSPPIMLLLVMTGHLSKDSKQLPLAHFLCLLLCIFFAYLFFSIRCLTQFTHLLWHCKCIYPTWCDPRGWPGVKGRLILTGCNFNFREEAWYKKLRTLQFWQCLYFVFVLVFRNTIVLGWKNGRRENDCILDRQVNGWTDICIDSCVERWM